MLTVRELAIGSGIGSSCDLMVWGSLTAVMWAKK